VVSPGLANVGIIPGEGCAPGRVGFVSRSGTLVYQIVYELTSRGIGQSTCIGMGGDPVHGIGFIESLALFEGDPDTDLMIMTGEIGGDDEERAASSIAEGITMPVVAYLAGFEAPVAKRVGHAETLASVRVTFIARSSAGPGTPSIGSASQAGTVLEVAMGALAIAVVILAFRAGREQARGLEERPLAAAIAGAVPSVGFAVPMVLVAPFVTLGFPQ